MAYGPARLSGPETTLPGTTLPESHWLASTADRERAVDVLRAGFAEGRLTQEEFDDRTARAYASRTYGELGELTADLPAGPLGALPMTVPVGLPGSRTMARHVPPAAQPEPDTRPVTSTAGLMLTALVVFTLAALITSVAVYLHSHGYGYGFAHPGGQIHLMPEINPAKSVPAPPVP